MRLWHQALIPHLPRQQLLGQHRECCALRGNGWGKKHATVNYVFRYPLEDLVAYHYHIISEMKRRGYFVNELWMSPGYCGKIKPGLSSFSLVRIFQSYIRDKVYLEHDQAYLSECIYNLYLKGIFIELGRCRISA